MTEQQPETPLSGCLLRMFWMMLGPAMLVIVGLVLVLYHPHLGSVLDFVLAGAAVLSIGARMLDTHKDIQGKVSPADVSLMNPTKYVIGVLLVVVALFVFAHFVAPKLF